MKETNNVEQRPRTSLSKGARRNQILRRITVVGVIAAVITAAFAGYCLHRERVEEKQKAEELRKEKQDKKEAAKVKSKPETAEQKLERVRKQATEHGYPKNVIELLDKNVETVDFVADYEKKKDKPYADRYCQCRQNPFSLFHNKILPPFFYIIKYRHITCLYFIGYFIFHHTYRDNTSDMHHLLHSPSSLHFRRTI